MDDLLSMQQAAEELNLSNTLVRRVCQESRLGCFKLPGGRDWLIRCANVEEYCDNRPPVGRPAKSSAEEEE